MLPAANPAGAAVVKPSQPITGQTGERAAQPQAPETARASAGEAGAANVKAETAVAIKAAEQSAIAARLRDQENSEGTAREPAVKDVPTGPPPSFEESPLERQARVAFDPPEEEITAPKPVESDAEPQRVEVDDDAPPDPPPSRTERAETSFAETQTIAEPQQPAKVDVAL